MNEEIKEGYKVVVYYKDSYNIITYRSATSIAESVVYSINRFIKRPSLCGPLVVFDTFNNADLFLGRLSPRGRKIFKCKYIKSKDCELWYLDGSERRYNQSVSEFPTGTIFADKVMLRGFNK